MKYLEQAGDLARKYKFYRTVGQAMIESGRTLIAMAGDLNSAEERAVIGSMQAGGLETDITFPAILPYWQTLKLG